MPVNDINLSILRLAKYVYIHTFWVKYL